MIRARLQLGVLAATTLTVLGGLCLLGCSDEGTTPACPPLPIYDVSNPAALTPAIIQQRALAVQAGCLTEVGVGSGGNGGTGGTGGAGSTR